MDRSTQRHVSHAIHVINEGDQLDEVDTSGHNLTHK